MAHNYKAQRDVFGKELQALCEKHQMSIVAAYERKDYATKSDIDEAHSMLVWMASRADMAGLIENLIHSYPELSAILLMGQIGKLSEEKPGGLFGNSGLFGGKKSRSEDPRPEPDIYAEAAQKMKAARDTKGNPLEITPEAVRNFIDATLGKSEPKVKVVELNGDSDEMKNLIELLERMSKRAA